MGTINKISDSTYQLVTETYTITMFDHPTNMALSTSEAVQNSTGNAVHCSGIANLAMRQCLHDFGTVVLDGYFDGNGFFDQVNATEGAEYRPANTAPATTTIQ